MISKSTILIRTLLLVFVLISKLSVAQTAIDVSCQQDVFYGMSGGNVHALQMLSGSVIDLGVIASSSLNLYALGFGNDITTNSTNRTFYSTKPDATFLLSTILRYTGTTWDSLTTDSIIYHNSGGNGSHIYFQHIRSINITTNDQCISRLNPNGTLTKIFTDTTLLFTVSDIAVDSLGNVYCFRGTNIGSTTELTVLDPNGNIIQSYATNLNNLGTLYGAFFLNGTLYLGWNTTNGKIYPVNFSGTTASLGVGLNSPAGISFVDLSNCHEIKIVEGITTDQSDGEVKIFPNPSTGNFTIDIGIEKAQIRIYDATGRMINEFDDAVGKVDLQLDHSGIYTVLIKSSDKLLREKVMVIPL